MDQFTDSCWVTGEPVKPLSMEELTDLLKDFKPLPRLDIKTGCPPGLVMLALKMCGAEIASSQPSTDDDYQSWVAARASICGTDIQLDTSIPFDEIHAFEDGELKVVQKIPIEKIQEAHRKSLLREFGLGRHRRTARPHHRACH